MSRSSPHKFSKRVMAYNNRTEAHPNPTLQAMMRKEELERRAKAVKAMQASQGLITQELEHGTGLNPLRWLVHAFVRAPTRMDYEHRIRCAQLTSPVEMQHNASAVVEEEQEQEGRGDGEDGRGGEGGVGGMLPGGMLPGGVLPPMCPRTKPGTPADAASRSRVASVTASGVVTAMAKGSAALAAAPLRAAMRRDRGRLESVAAADLTLTKMVTSPLTSMRALTSASGTARMKKRRGP